MLKPAYFFEELRTLPSVMRLIVPIIQAHKPWGVVCLLAFVILGCGASDAERIGATAGLSFPSSATLVLKENHCCDFFGDGDMWRIYELEEGTTWIDEQHCQERGFEKGLYEDMRLKLSTFAEFIDHEQNWCYKIIKDETQSLRAVMIQQDRIYFYQTWN